MNVLRMNRSSRSLMNAVRLGLALSFLLSLILTIAGPIGEIPGATESGSSLGTSVIVSAATAAVPGSGSLPAPAPLVAGAALDEFRLDPDSCCVSHY